MKARRGIHEGVTFKQCFERHTFELSLRRQGAVAGVGLFAESPLPRRSTLGFFTGQRVTRMEALERLSKKAKCIISYEGLEGKVWLDGSRGLVSVFQRINSSRGSGLAANVEFAVFQDRLTVRTLRTVQPGEELLADYDWRHADEQPRS